MKIAIFALFLVFLLAPSIEARTITEEVQVGNSVIIENQKVSLVEVNTKDDKAIICVNGAKGIISRDVDRTINNVMVELRSVSSNSAKLRLESNCDDCIENDNSICFNECILNSDCNDKNETTIDQCLGTPKKCVYNEIEVIEELPQPVQPEEINISLIFKEPKKEGRPSSLLAIILNFISNLFN